MADQEEALMKLQMENAELEKAIMDLTKKSTMANTSAAFEPPAPATGIRVLSYPGTSMASDGAGIDNGSAWCPASTGRRTVLGGFFTS